jgi:hypothetical protein
VFRAGDDWVEIDPAKLPAGSYELDIDPPGHVSITASPEAIQKAVVGKGRWPK